MSTMGAGATGDQALAAAQVDKETAGFGTLLLPLLIAQALVTADFTCMNSMIGDIAHDLGSSLTGLQTTMALSFLVMGALIIPASRIGGRRGHARVLALGAAILALGDVVSAVSTSLPVLLIGKALIAAIGSALIVPAVFSLATLHYEGATRKRALGLINVQLGTGTIAGAFIGGWLATNASWRWWFVVEVAVGVVLVLLMRPHFEKGMRAKVSEFDVLGTLLSFIGLALIVLGIHPGQRVRVRQGTSGLPPVRRQAAEQGGVVADAAAHRAWIAIPGRVRGGGAPADRSRQGTARSPRGAW